jgi:nucleotidyltransferase substrate binding protein (TIGR01987 family)
MENKDIRWKQRFNNFTRAFSQLKKFVDKGEELNELEEQGLIQAFEYNFELSWNLIKDYYEYQGDIAIQGSRDAFRLAYNRGLIKDGAIWMNMIDSRIKTSHTYNEDTAREIASAILNRYFYLFTELHQTMEKLVNKQDDLFNEA